MEVANAGELVRKLRKEKGLTLQDLSEKVGVNYVNLSLIERGKSNTNPQTVFKLAKALGIEYDQLYDLFYKK